MEWLEAKQVKGHTYYYYSKWAWVDNRCRRVWQKYLGKTRGHRRGRSRWWASAHLRRGLPVGIVAGPLAGSYSR